MASPRWQKVAREIWKNPKRTLLVVLSIAAGVIALGTVAGTYTVITRELPAGYARVNPASATLYVEPFDDTLLRVVRNLPGVEAADGRRTVTMRLQAGVSPWRDVEMFSLPDYDNLQVARLWPERGAWPPAPRELLIERAAMELAGLRIGDIVTLEAANGTQRSLPVSGVVYDINRPSARFANRLYGYVHPGTMEWLGVEGDYNQLDIVVAERKLDRGHIASVAGEVRGKVEKSGRDVYWLSIPEPGKHPFERFLGPMALLLTALGLLCLFLSGFLVVNTITALLAQQIRQIGVMKAIGARTGQIAGLYVGMVLLLGLLALLISIPTSLLATRSLVGFMAGLVNFDVASYQPPAWVFGLQVMAALLVPLLAALVPVFKGSRITVREAINSYGLAEGQQGSGLLLTLLGQVRGLSRPVLLAIRSTFRRRARLVLTLLTLALASTIFIAVLSVRASLLRTLDDALAHWQYDVGVSFVRPYRVEEIERQAMLVPGVTHAESWGYQTARRLRPDNTNSDALIMIAPPADTRLLQPTLLAGRWLLPEDENAIVITTDLLREEPGLRVGDAVELEMDGRLSTWVVVGLMRGVLSGPTMYANYPYFARAMRSPAQASTVQVVTGQHTPAFQRQLAGALEEQFERSGLRVVSTTTLAELRRVAIAQFGVIIIFLLAMALLLAIVGALGLAGTMSINVLERTREIGMMRAIGATGRTVRRMVVVEGGLIGLLSWILGTALAIPISQVLSRSVGLSFLQTPLSYRFAPEGAAIWLVAVLILAAIASLLPARDASRVSVRDALAYE